MQIVGDSNNQYMSMEYQVTVTKREKKPNAPLNYMEEMECFGVVLYYNGDDHLV